MKITEITLVPKNIQDTESSATTSSAAIAGKTQEKNIQTIRPSRKASARSLDVPKAVGPSRVSGVHLVLGKVVSWQNQAPVS
jgi:hypothetical protein